MAQTVRFEAGPPCEACGSPTKVRVTEVSGDAGTMRDARRQVECLNAECPGEDENQAAARVVRQATEGK